MSGTSPGGATLTAVYQPIVELRTGRVMAVEGLVRGVRETGTVSPGELFSEAAQDGPAAVLRLDEACMRCVVDQASGLVEGATLFVNAEPSTLAGLSPESWACTAALLPASVQVVVEITERDLLRHPAGTLAGVKRARELGWRIAVDDVGAEPAALALIPFFRPDVIKLDLALVRGRPSLDVAAIINAVHAEAQRSGALVVAEGIETRDHLERALSLGATLGQGWYFSRPGPLPRSWHATLPLPPARELRNEAYSVFEVVRREVAAQPTTPALLAPLTRHIERQAMLLDEMTLVLASFQHADHLSPATLRRYQALGMVTALTAVLAPGVSPEPAPDVQGTSLPDDDPLAQEWVVAVISPHFAAVIAAREAGGHGAPTARPDVSRDEPARRPDGPADSASRRLEYVLSYDRETAVAAAELLLSRLQPGVSLRRPAALDRDNSPQKADVAGTPLAGPLAGRVVRRNSVAGVPRSELPGLLTRAISTAANGIVIADARAPDMPLIYVNAAFEQLTGYSEQEVLGRNCRFLQGPGSDRTLVRMVSRRLAAGRGVQFTLLNYRRDGSAFWNEVSISPVHDDRGVLTHFIGNQVDVSTRVDRDDRTSYLAYHDALTGLPNRVSVLEHLEMELRRSARTGSGVGVVFVDLNGFKEVNDAHGHGVGDEALVAAARRLQTAVRSGDVLARLGGDEFLLVVTGIAPGNEATSVRRVVENLHTALAAPVDVGQRRLRLSAAIGSAVSPLDGRAAAALVDLADARMYQLKASSSRTAE